MVRKRGQATFRGNRTNLWCAEKWDANTYRDMVPNGRRLFASPFRFRDG